MRGGRTDYLALVIFVPRGGGGFARRLALVHYLGFASGELLWGHVTVSARRAHTDDAGGGAQITWPLWNLSHAEDTTEPFCTIMRTMSCCRSLRDSSLVLNASCTSSPLAPHANTIPRCSAVWKHFSTRKASLIVWPPRRQPVTTHHGFAY